MKYLGHLEKYSQELEFIYIKHLLYGGIGRFLEYKEGRKEVKKIVHMVKGKYANWRKNVYYQNQTMMFKLNCNIFYSNCLWIIIPFQKLKNCIKRGKTWKD